jgi:DNA polymerase III alpha subunit
VRILGWLVTAKPVLTIQDEAMEFLSFEDETAIVEAVLFPAAYVRYRQLLFAEGPLWVSGIVEKDRGAVTLSIEELSSAR